MTPFLRLTNQKMVLLSLIPFYKINIINTKDKRHSLFSHMGSTCSRCERVSEGITFGTSDKSKVVSRFPRGRNINGSMRDDVPHKNKPPDKRHETTTHRVALDRWSARVRVVSMPNTSNIATTHAASLATHRQTIPISRASNPLVQTVYRGPQSPGVVPARGLISPVTSDEEEPCTPERSVSMPVPLFRKSEPPDTPYESTTQLIQLTLHEVDESIPVDRHQADFGHDVLNQAIVFVPPCTNNEHLLWRAISHPGKREAG
jgi:hypothetical protein